MSINYEIITRRRTGEESHNMIVLFYHTRKIVKNIGG